MSRPALYRLTYRDRIALRKAVEASLLRGLRRRRHPRLTLLGPGDPSDPDTADTEPAPPPSRDWDTEAPTSDPPTDPDLDSEDTHDLASRTVL